MTTIISRPQLFVCAKDHLNGNASFRKDPPVLVRDSIEPPLVDRARLNGLARALACSGDCIDASSNADQIGNSLHEIEDMEVNSTFQAIFFVLCGTKLRDRFSPMNETWAERLDRWRREAGWSVAEYIRRVNADGGSEITGDSIRKYLKGGVAQPRGDVMARLAAPFGKSEIELRYGIDNTVNSDGRIRLLTANEIGTLNPAEKLSREGSSVSVLSRDVGENWFGVTVPDDACAPKIAKGAIVVCDPDAEAMPGSYVIARIPGVQSGVCRRYRKSDGLEPNSFELLPEDDDYPRYVSTPESPITVWPIVKIWVDPPRGA